MGDMVTAKLIQRHMVEGAFKVVSRAALKIDQVLFLDVIRPLCALQLETKGASEVVVTYINHLMLEDGPRDAQDHLLQESAAQRFGMRFSRAGNGISYPIHQQRFGVPGKTLLGMDP